jgi:thiol-disulfide isomerase/thioredoxin/uncharacterized protein YjbJ (UPF0337 family)
MAKEDCGCGGGSKCITKNKFFKWVKEELKRLDCGCGCKGRKAFEKKHGKLIGGAILKDCPPGWRNDGLTCVENCKEDEFDDGLTCRKKCEPGWIDDGLTCRKPITSSMNSCPEGSRDIAGTCWGPVRKDCIDDCFKHPAPGCKTWECGRLRGLFNEDWGPKLCTSCNLRCGQTCWDVQGITKQLHQRELKLFGGEVIAQLIRSKQIRGRVNWDELGKVMDQGVKDLLAGNIDLAAAFDPEKNGVNAAFRKFGDDINGALKEIEGKIKDGFKKMGDDARRAFEELAKNAERDFKQFGADFVAKMKDPDFWIEFAAIMTEVALYAAAMAVTATGVGAGFAPGLLAAAAMAGPSIRMIGKAAQGEPIDALDIVELAIAGASAAVPGLSGFTQTAMKVGVQAAKVTVMVVKTGQGLGMIPSSCIANCPPPPPQPPFTEPPLEPEIPGPVIPGQLTYEEIAALQPANTIKRMLKDPRRENPEYIFEADWVAQYRLENYGAEMTDESGAMTTPEDKAVENITTVELNKDEIKIEPGFPDFPPLAESSDFPAFGESSDFPAFGESSDFPAFGESSDFPAFGESSDFPAFGESSDFPSFGESSDFPAFGESSDFPAFGETTDFPAFGETTDFPAFGETTDFPAFGETTDFPAFGETTDFPSTESTAIIPFEPESTAIIPFEPSAPPSVPTPSLQEKERDVYYLSEEQLESDSFMPRALIGGAQLDERDVINPIIEGDTYRNPFGTMTSALPKANIPRSHTGAEFNPDCYARHNPEVAQAVGNDKGKLTTHWIEIGSKQGLDADCGNSLSTAEERMKLMIEKEAERQSLEGRKTNCKATDKFWVEAENRCDGLRHADGRENPASGKCSQEGSHYEQRANMKPYCNRYRNLENNLKTAEERCISRNNRWENNKCDRTKNVDGSDKTDSDYCTGLNNYYKDGVCDVTKDRDGKPRTEEQLCHENAGHYVIDPVAWWNKNKDNQDLISKGAKDPRTMVDVGGPPGMFGEKIPNWRFPDNSRFYTPENTQGTAKCDVKVYPDGIVKKGKQEICQTILNGNLIGTECLNVEGEYPATFDQMKEYLQTKKLGFYTFERPPRDRINLQAIEGGGKPGKSLTLYWAEWCPHCHTIMPEWKKLGSSYKGIKIEAIEESVSPVKVDGYPTIIFRNGKKMEKYKGPRTKAAIVKFLKNKLSNK